MKRPEIDGYVRDIDYRDRMETYADQLEEDVATFESALDNAETELANWKEHVFDDELTFSDGHGNEIPLDDVCECDVTGNEILPDDVCEGDVIGLDSEGGVVFGVIPDEDEDLSPEETMFYMLDLIGEMVAELKEMVSDE